MITTTRAVWVCVGGCVGGKWPLHMSRCPHCHGPVEREEMPKISVHGGPSDAITGQGMPEPTHIDGEPVKASSTGVDNPVDNPGESTAPETDQVPSGESTAPETDQVPSDESSRDAVADAAETRNYSRMLKADLQDEATSRGLDASGTADELRERLTENDQSKAPTA